MGLTESLQRWGDAFDGTWPDDHTLIIQEEDVYATFYLLTPHLIRFSCSARHRTIGYIESLFRTIHDPFLVFSSDVPYGMTKWFTNRKEWDAWMGRLLSVGEYIGQKRSGRLLWFADQRGFPLLECVPRWGNGPELAFYERGEEAPSCVLASHDQVEAFLSHIDRPRQEREAYMKGVLACFRAYDEKAMLEEEKDQTYVHAFGTFFSLSFGVHTLFPCTFYTRLNKDETEITSTQEAIRWVEGKVYDAFIANRLRWLMKKSL